MSSEKEPEVMLLIATGCAHCPTVMTHLSTLVKEGSISKLEIINIQQSPEIAETYNVRSVPWMKLDDYTLTGTQSLEELRQWIQISKSEDGLQHYIEQQLTNGELEKIITEIKQYPAWLKTIIDLLESDDTAMQVRLGIDTLIEHMASTDAGTDMLQSQIDKLGKLSQNIHPSRQADIIYYLGLSKSQKAIPYIEKFLQHSNPDIIEISHDALEEIKNAE